MPTCIAVLNAGSSSIKFAMRDADSANALLFRGQIEGIGVAPHIRIRDAKNETIADRTWPADGFTVNPKLARECQASLDEMRAERMREITRAA